MGMFETLRSAAEVAQKIGNIELYRQLLEAQQTALELADENRQLKEQLRQRDERDRVQADLVFDDAAYRLRSEPNGPFYCPACWVTHKQLVPLVSLPDSALHRCVRCDKRWPRPSTAENVRRTIRNTTLVN
jgi:hypothetical protein